jgi:DNA-binding Lrp family transcriptional regulator
MQKHTQNKTDPTMDKTDVILCQLLLANSRMPYRELAEKLNLSVTAVHNRIQILIEIGIIRKFTTKLSFISKGGTPILFFGTSKTTQIRELSTKLEKHGCIYWLAIGGGNVLYIGAYLKRIDELESLVRFIKETAQMTEPTVGLTISPTPVLLKGIELETKLCELDYGIIRSLKDNSRKATSEVAVELGVSAKTVSRRLNRMIKNYLVNLSIDWYPDASNDIISAFHIQLKPEATPNAVNAVWQKYYPNTLFYWGFSNIPNTYVFVTWTPSSKELRELRESLEEETAVQTVAPNILYTGYIYKTWIDDIP